MTALGVVQRMKISTKLFCAVLALNLVTTMAFTLYAYQGQKSTILRDIDAKLLALAEGVRLNGDQYHDKIGVSGAIAPQEYQGWLDGLSRYAEATKVKYLYTVLRKDGKIVFTSSSYTKEEQLKGDTTKLFDPYEDASAGLKAALSDRTVHYDQYTDKWGTFRSIFLPAKSPGGTEYVIGVDISLSQIDGLLRAYLVKCLLIALAVYALGMLGVLLVIKPLQRAIQHLAWGAGQIADGNLAIVLEKRNEDELGLLADDMNRMTERLRSIIGDVKGSAERMATASEHLSATADQMAAGASRVSDQVESVATAGEEMACTSGEIAQNCAMAAEVALKASTSAASGAQVVANAVDAMNRIALRVKDSAQTVAGLGQRSEQISEILGTIEDIADQTNLLALNAAIEAARAGEQGRGFAVVADEVRALAERTTRATGEIAQMIKVIQDETRRAVSSMDQGVTEVELGTREADNSGAALREIIEHIEGVTAQINQVATAAEEQTGTTREISSNMVQITEVVQQTSQGARDSAGEATRLSGNAAELQQLVRQFRF
jgi:methyl-accepting chemotaxis protein